MIKHFRASLIAWVVKNPPAMQERPVRSWVRKIPWRRDRLPTPAFLGFPGGSAGKESACNAETWVQSLSWEDALKNGKAPTPVFWPREFHGLYDTVSQRVGHD